MKTFSKKNLEWLRNPADCRIEPDRIEITTLPHTDLWQRTYYHFQNDNAPVLQMETEEKFFSFVVRTDFTESCHRFDQCGIVMYLDSENWLKGSVEYENDSFQHLGSVVTNHGYSDWATTAIPADVKVMWYRFSRREDDYCIECSADGVTFSQMRVCHMWEGAGKIRFGIYACSPEDSSFKAVFTDMRVTDCAWKAHDGQQPDPPDAASGYEGSPERKKLFSEIPFLRGKRLTLKRLTPADRAGLQELVDSDRVYRRLPTFLSEKKYPDPGEVIDQLYDECRMDSILLGVFLGEEFCGLAEMYGYRESARGISLGCRLLERFWGKGIAGEALEMMVDYLFNETDIEIITAHTMVENQASAGVLRKTGFRLAVHAAEEDWGYGEPTLADKWILQKAAAGQNPNAVR